MPYEKDPDELGALWAKEGTSGPYMTGTINGVNVVCWPNKSTNPNAPSWRVKKSKPVTERRHTRDGASVTADDIPF